MLEINDERVFSDYSMVMTDMIAKIYQHCGYSVSYCLLGAGEMQDNILYIPDLMLEKNGETSIVEIKAPRSMVYRLPENAAKDFFFGAAEAYPNYRKVLLFVCEISETSKRRIQDMLSKANVDVDSYELKELKDLVKMAESDAELYTEFMALLPQSVQSEDTSSPKTEKDKLNQLIKEVQNWKVCDENGKNQHSAYETLCLNVLMALFGNELDAWKKQSTTYDGLNRFDIVCRIKTKDNEFWTLLEQHFHSKYIIFECKNYSNQYTQGEVYTTEKYLFSTALRKVAIIVSVNGADKNANKAIRCVLRETGKLIISVTHKDLIRMLECKRDGQNPAVEVLLDLLDNLMIALEK